MIEVERTGAAPNASLCAVIVPGAAAGLPAPAPMLSVPIAPAFVAITTGPQLDNAAVRNRERARAQVANVQPEVLPQVEPGAGHRHRSLRACTIADVGGRRGEILMTVPPFAIMSVPVPKLPILSPPLGPFVQLEPGPVTVTVPVRADSQSDGAAATIHRAAVLNCKRARALAADHDASGIRPVGARAGHRHCAQPAR